MKTKILIALLTTAAIMGASPVFADDQPNIQYSQQGTSASRSQGSTSTQQQNVSTAQEGTSDTPSTPASSTPQPVYKRTYNWNGTYQLGKTHTVKYRFRKHHYHKLQLDGDSVSIGTN